MTDPQPSPPDCQWTPDEDGIFHTSCDHAFYFDGDGGPTEHKLKFCGYCGRSLREMPFVEVNDDDAD